MASSSLHAMGRIRKSLARKVLLRPIMQTEGGVVKKVISILLSTTLGAVLLASACAPKTTPSPTPATPPAKMVVTAPSTTSAQTPTVWDKTVADAKKEGRLTMYTWAFVGDQGKEVISGFEKAFGIKIETVGGVGATLMERIKTERAAGKQIADTYDTAMPFLIAAKQAGLIGRIDYLPELEKKVEWRVKPIDPDNTIFSHYVSIGTTYVNTSLVKQGSEPKSYQELLQPQWKGKILLAPPSLFPATMYPYVAGKKYGIAGLGDDYYRQLGKHDLKIVFSVNDVTASLARGDAPVVFHSTGGAMNPSILAGAPMKPVNMEEGQVMQWGAGITMVKDAPHPNAAAVFINWLLTTEGQIASNRARGTPAMRTDVPDFTPEKGRLDIKKPLALDLQDLIEMSRLQREAVVDKIMGVEMK